MAREIEEYRALHLRGLDRLPFVQRFVGVVETDFGVGMVVRKVRDRDGRLAPTVSAVVERIGLTDELRAQIADLFAEVIRHHVVFGDIRSINILQANDDEHGNRLVIIDGLGDYLWLPVNTWSRLAYRIYCERRLARAMEKLESIDRARTAG
jgi:hypothetical protein